ncbi:MAG TPA: hypothetical protein QGG47_03480 [Acidobacteriota bacterium]|nr:hypothetical protein [Acidobacteriota bacterium]
MKISRVLELLLGIAIVVLLASSLIPTDAGADWIKKPSTIRNLGTPDIAPGGNQPLLWSTPDAVNGGDFVVPDNMAYAITSITVIPQQPGAGTNTIRFNLDGRGRYFWVVPNEHLTHLVFPAGIVVGPGWALNIDNVAQSAGVVTVNVDGYPYRDR